MVIRWVEDWRFVPRPSWYALQYVVVMIIGVGRPCKRIFLTHITIRNFYFFLLKDADGCIREVISMQCFQGQLLVSSRQSISAAIWWASSDVLLPYWLHLHLIIDKILVNAVFVLQHLLHAWRRVEYRWHRHRGICKIEKWHLLINNINYTSIN